MKIEWLVADVTPVGSPYSAKGGILEAMLDVFGQFRPLSGSGSNFVM